LLRRRTLLRGLCLRAAHSVLLDIMMFSAAIRSRCTARSAALGPASFLFRFLRPALETEKLQTHASIVTCTSARQDEAKQEPESHGYFAKFKGQVGAASPSASVRDIALSGLGALTGMGAVSSVHFVLVPYLEKTFPGLLEGAGFTMSDATMILGSFGASCVLIFGYHGVPFSQPRNVIGGHVLSATVGVSTAHMLHIPYDAPHIAAPVAVSLATIVMMSTKCVHPPAGGTSLIACMGSAKIHALGFYFLIPTAIGATTLVMVGALYNNLHKGRSYPSYWL
jgi:hypothetical protein